MPDSYWVQNFNPVFFQIGSFQIRYYGLFFAGAMIQGGYFWTRQIIRSGRHLIDAIPLIWMAIFGVLIGGRLGTVLFYNMGQFLKEPLILINFGRGGFASHGATAGILIALWLYSRLYQMPYLEALDRCSLSIPLGASLVRIGNFFNSEIVGRVTDIPWAIIFKQYDQFYGLPPLPRHPVQLYEAAAGVLIFLVLYLTDRKLGETRPRGLMTGLILSNYFTFRFFIEFFKNPQNPDPLFPLTTGQILSLPFILVGWTVFFSSMRTFKK